MSLILLGSKFVQKNIVPDFTFVFNPNDAWLVLRGAPTDNAYIGYAPVTNAEYAAFNPSFVYDKAQANYPVVNVTIADAIAYCNWLTSQDRKHAYCLPTDEKWILLPGAHAEGCGNELRTCEKRLDGSGCLSANDWSCCTMPLLFFILCNPSPQPSWSLC